MKKSAILIVSHGSRSIDAVREFEQLVELVEQNGDFNMVRGAHMELAEPDIPTVLKEMVELGMKDILVLPYFLFNGNHIKNDIPDIIAEQQLCYPEVNVKMGKHIGFDPIMADVVIRRANEFYNV